MNCKPRQQVHSYDTVRYVGYEQDYNINALIFTEENISRIQTEVSRLLRGVDPKGREIRVTRDVVIKALDNINQGFIPQVGDIYGRYNVVDENRRSDISTIVNMTINFIASAVKTDLEIQEANSKLTVWTTVLGDFNEHGLRRHDIIKMRERRPDPMMFNMNY